MVTVIVGEAVGVGSAGTVTVAEALILEEEAPAVESVAVVLGLDGTVGDAVGVRPVLTVTVSVSEELPLVEKVPDVVVEAVGVGEEVLLLMLPETVTFTLEKAESDGVIGAEIEGVAITVTLGVIVAVILGVIAAVMLGVGVIVAVTLGVIVAVTLGELVGLF